MTASTMEGLSSFLASTFGLNTINSTIGCNTCENFEFHCKEVQTICSMLKNERMKKVCKMRNSMTYWMLLALTQYKCTSVTFFTSTNADTCSQRATDTDIELQFWRPSY